MMPNSLFHYWRLLAPLAAVGELHRAAEQRLQRVAARDDLLVPGQRLSHLLLLIDGMACRHSLLHNGRRQITAMLLPGDIVGFDAMPGWRSLDSATALTSVECLRIPAGIARASIEGNSALSSLLRGIQDMQQAIGREWMVNVGGRLARDRMAHFFCEMFRRAHVLGLCCDSTCQLPLNQIELADVTALTPVHVNRVLATLRRDTGTSLHKGVLHVPDLGALEKLAGYDFRYLDPVPADNDVNGREPPCMAAGMGFEAQTLLQELHSPTSV